MIGNFFKVARLAVGVKIFYDIANDFFNPQLDGIEYHDRQYQDNINQVCKIAGITKKVFVRQVSEFKGKPMVFSKGSLFLGRSQICIPEDCSFSISILKFASVHELGHLYNNDQVIIGAIIVMNIALFTIPTIPIRVFGSSIGLTCLSFIPLYRWMERRADDFAFKHCSGEIIRDAFQSNSSSAKKKSWLNTLFVKYVAVGNPEKREAARTNNF